MVRSSSRTRTRTAVSGVLEYLAVFSISSFSTKEMLFSAASRLIRPLAFSR